MAGRLEAAKGVTFAECAQRYIAAQESGWRNAKHAAQWSSTLRTYVAPVIGRLPVQEINTSLILQVLKPLWGVKTETASRVRGRVEAIIDWATHMNIAAAITLPAGAAIWTSSLHLGQRSDVLHITRRCRIASCQTFRRKFSNTMPTLRGRWSS